MWGPGQPWLPAEAEKFLASSAPWPGLAWAPAGWSPSSSLRITAPGASGGLTSANQRPGEPTSANQSRAGQPVCYQHRCEPAGLAWPGWLVIRDQDSPELQSSDTSFAWILYRLSSTFKVFMLGMDFIWIYLTITCADNTLKHSLQLALLFHDVSADNINVASC